jgi:MFS family permease
MAEPPHGLDSPRATEPRSAVARFLALNRTVAVVLLTVLLFGLGEELWGTFMPAYLRAQATLWAVGLYGLLRNLFEGFCYIGGGQLTARLGDRGSLMFFACLTIGGYGLFLLSSALGPGATWLAIAAALLIIGWEPLSVPVTFTTVGSTVTPTRRGMAFAVQSIQKRLPKILGPALAGWVVWQLDEIAGMRVLVSAALGLAVVSLAVQFAYMPHREPLPPGPSSRAILRDLHPSLRRLLLAEIFTRWCDWLVRDFVILYLLLVQGVSPVTAGLLFTLQHTTALLTYLPIGRMTEKVGLQPFIGLTFVFFALFPLALALVPGPPWLPVAFVVYGLREVGEPARKALITSLMPEEVRARGVGLYWGLRSFAICWASLVGAAVWDAFGPEALLYTAFGLGCVGAAVYYLTCRRTPASAAPAP